jgi:uncharacterized peroxidase-related enzyme
VLEYFSDHSFELQIIIDRGRKKMTWIKTVEEDEASGALKPYYESIKKQMGMVPNIIKSLSLKPEAMRATFALANAITFGGSDLTRAQEEMIATVVSARNRCHY